MSKRGVHGFPRSGAALAPYKYFAEQNLGAGAIHLPRACQKASGFPSGMAGWEGRGGGDADSGGISDLQAAGRMKGRTLWPPLHGSYGYPYERLNSSRSPTTIRKPPKQRWSSSTSRPVAAQAARAVPAGGDADSGGISDLQAAGRMKGRTLWPPLHGSYGYPYERLNSSRSPTTIRKPPKQRWSSSTSRPVAAQAARAVPASPARTAGQTV